jgi:hypothetical protein
MADVYGLIRARMALSRIRGTRSEKLAGLLQSQKLRRAAIVERIGAMRARRSGRAEMCTPGLARERLSQLLTLIRALA